MIKHINLTGASGVGKTTLVNLLHEDDNFKDYLIYNSPIKNLSTDNNFSLNESGTEKGQEIIFNYYKDLLFESDDKYYISDRCLIDPVAYTMYLVANNKVDRELLRIQWNELKDIVSKGMLRKVFYIPIEFDVEDNGIRSTDKEYQKEIDASVEAICHDLRRMYPDKFSYINIVGTSQERKELIKRYV